MNGDAMTPRGLDSAVSLEEDAPEEPRVAPISPTLPMEMHRNEDTAHSTSRSRDLN